MKRFWFLIFGVVLAFSVLGDWLFVRDHAASWWQQISGFFAIFGLIFCIVIVIASKFLGHLWLQRKEDYYDGDDSDG